MLPFLGDSGKRRNINLGGSSAATHDSLVQQAKARRLERERARKREECVIKIQAFVRARQDARKAMRRLQQEFDEGMSLLDATRFLVIFGSKDEQRLTAWCTQLAQTDDDALCTFLSGSQASKWIVLLQQMSIVLLNSASRSPSSSSSPLYLTTLNRLLDPHAYRPLGSIGSHTVVSHLSKYVLSHKGYFATREALLALPPEQKSSPLLPHIISLCLKLLSDLSGLPEYNLCIYEFFRWILTVPQLPNRLPLTTVTTLSAHMPFSDLERLRISDFEVLSLEERAHMIANLSTFIQPRYLKLSAESLKVCLSLFVLMLRDIPASCFETGRRSNGWTGVHGDSDDEETITTIVYEFTPPGPSISLDNRTSSRIKALQTSSHLKSIILATNRFSSLRPYMFSLILTLCDIFPSKSDDVWGIVASNGGAGFVREVFREFVRSSPLGKDSSSSVVDPATVGHWLGLIFMTRLYNHLLLTMGDDEFFAPSHQTPRNPLSLDEVNVFSRHLLRVTFLLYWQADQSIMKQRCTSTPRLSWETVREQCTKCLQALHSRDSRRPFAQPGHWLCTNELDIRSFVEAAISEEKTLDPGRPNISKRQMAYLSPRLGVLNNIPFAIPFEVRVAIFRQFIYNERRRLGFEEFIPIRSRNKVTVRRGKIAQDGFDHLREVDMKSDFQVTFIDQWGNEEMGIDGGGVFKEFLTSLAKEVFDTDRGLWLQNDQHELYPNPHSYATEPHSLDWFRFIGRVLGKALYEGILVDVAFAGFFLAKWLGKQSFLDDLASLDRELYNGLLHLKREEDPESLGLDFTITEDEFGMTRDVELVPNGASTPVTRENRLQYIYLVAHYHLSRKIKLQSEAFFDGLSTMVDPKWLRMFNQQEMQLLISGADIPIDIQDLRDNTLYGGVYDDNEETIRLFWDVVESFTQEQRQALLRFATSCSRPPLLGFKELNPKFSIRDASSDQSRLPTASTCVNLLKLPRYKSAKILREKMLQAIFSNAGFDLS